MNPMKTTTLSLLILLFVASAAVAGLEPGDQAPGFTLTDTEGVEVTLQDFLDEGMIVVLEWFNPDCPFIKKHHLNNKTFNETASEFSEMDVVWLAINSSAKGNQGSGLERNQQAVQEYCIPYPVLMDESGEVGHAYGAKTTPHMFIIAPDGTIVYNGAIDDNRSADKLGETNYVAVALATLAEGKTIKTAETPPYGCSVKYSN
jgi:peroxiredoxin